MSLRSRRELQKKSKKAMSRTTEQKKKRDIHTASASDSTLYHPAVAPRSYEKKVNKKVRNF